MNGLSVTLGADISALKRSLEHAVGAVKGSAGRMSAIAATGMKVGLGAALAGGAAAVGVAVKAVTSAADFEQTKVAFTTLIGDAGKAEQTLAQLRKLGNETPFQFPELADAGRKLIAFGEGSDTVTETLRRIGDVSAGIQVPIGEIAEIYGKARVQGRLFAEDVNQLTGRGIPIIQELAKQFGVNDSEVRKLVESGKVGFPQIEKAFIDMTSQGGKFFGMMEAQSHTTKGLWSTLMDTFNDVLLTLGTPINDAIRPMIEQAIGLVQQLVPMAATAGVMIRDALLFVVGMFKSGQFLTLVGTTMKLGFAESVNFLWAAFRGTLSAVGQYLVELFKTAVMYFEILTTADFWKGMGNALIGVALSFLSFWQKGMAQLIEIARPLAEMFGQGDLIDSAQGALLDSSKMLDGEARARYDKSGDQLGPLADRVGQRLADAWTNIGNRFAETFQKTPDAIDTDGMRDAVGGVMNIIKDSIPKVEPVKVPTNTVPQDAGTNKVAASFEPIVTSLGRVGGGGYSTGPLDAQRENNRLTAETNRILSEVKDKLTGGTAKYAAVFG